MVQNLSGVLPSTRRDRPSPIHRAIAFLHSLSMDKTSLNATSRITKLPLIIDLKRTGNCFVPAGFLANGRSINDFVGLLLSNGNSHQS
ncbi:MAG: hypothetical protein RBJ76_08730 [Stenomitos frigidus ULC029]